MQKKYLDGKTYFPLTVQKQILELRPEIEKNAQHAGQKFELVKQAFNDILVAQGKRPWSFDNSCSGCILEANKILINWFKLYDQTGPSAKRMSVAPEFKPLKPINSIQAFKEKQVERARQNDDNYSRKPDDNTSEPSYKELLEKFNATATPEEKKALLKGRKTPTKKELNDYLNGK